MLRVLPQNIAQSIYYRFLNKHEVHLSHLDKFKESKLRLVPLKMFDLVPGDVISGNIAFNGFYENKLSQSLLKLAQSGGTLLDIGANMGYFTLLWAGANADNKVIAIEASPKVASLLKNNIKQNELSSRVIIHELAVGKENGEIEFSIGSDVQTGWGGITLEKNNSIKVPMKRIDEIINQEIDVLKIDIEGAEAWALMGAENLLKSKKIKRIFFEQNESRMKALGIDPNEVFNLLKRYDYNLVPFIEGHGKVIEWMAFI